MPGGSQPRSVARRPVETDAGGAFRGIEGSFQRRGEFRLLVAGVIASPASPRISLPIARPCAFLTRLQCWPRSASSNRQTGSRAAGRRLRAPDRLRPRSPAAASGRGVQRAKSRCLASVGNAASAAKPSSGRSLSQSRSSVLLCASSRRSAGVPARSFNELCSGSLSPANREDAGGSRTVRTDRRTAHTAPDRTPLRNRQRDVPW